MPKLQRGRFLHLTILVLIFVLALLMTKKDLRNNFNCQNKKILPAQAHSTATRPASSFEPLTIKINSSVSQYGRISASSIVSIESPVAVITSDSFFASRRMISFSKSSRWSLMATLVWFGFLFFFSLYLVVKHSKYIHKTKKIAQWCVLSIILNTQPLFSLLEKQLRIQEFK